MRAVEPVSDINLIKGNGQLKKNKLVRLTNDPGKLIRGLKIDMSFMFLKIKIYKILVTIIYFG